MTATLLRPSLAQFRSLIAVSMIILIAACSAPDDERTASPEAPVAEGEQLTILALGDSLTEGLGVPRDMNYPSQLERHLKSNGYPAARVINAGVSGETSSGLLQRLDWVLSQEPDIVILTIGANDAMRALPLELLKSNLTTMIERIQARDALLILGGMQIYDNLGVEYTSDFEAIYLQLAAEYQLPLIGFFLEGVAGIDALNNPDLIHPNADGYSIIVQHNILPILKPMLEQMHTADVADKLPESQRVNPSKG